jgi:hypothetical protein
LSTAVSFPPGSARATYRLHSAAGIFADNSFWVEVIVAAAGTTPAPPASTAVHDCAAFVADVTAFLSEAARVVRPGGADQHVYRVLSQFDARKECFVVGWPVHQQIFEFADKAGGMLPTWPEVPYLPLLEHAETWLKRVEKRREVAAQPWVFEGTEETIPSCEVAERIWSDLRLGPGCHQWVTDQRGNIERWLGFVFHVLMESDPESIEIRLIPIDNPLAYANREADRLERKIRGWPPATTALDRRWLIGANNDLYHYDQFDPIASRFSRLYVYHIDPAAWRLQSLLEADEDRSRQLDAEVRRLRRERDAFFRA